MLKRIKGDAKMKCPNCNADLKKVEVSVHGAKNKTISYQCTGCD